MHSPCFISDKIAETEKSLKGKEARNRTQAKKQLSLFYSQDEVKAKLQKMKQEQAQKHEEEMQRYHDYLKEEYPDLYALYLEEYSR